MEARVAQARVPALYRRIAPIYDLWAGLTEVRARRTCLERAQVRDGETVLEVAVGTGLAFRELVRANPSGLSEGVDLTEAMLDRARAKVQGLPGRHRLRVGDARALDFPDASFDLLPETDFAPVLGEFRRVLKPGGRLAMVNMATGGGFAARAYQGIYRLSPGLLGGCRGVALRPYVEAAGFVEVEMERVSQCGFPSEVIAARRPPAA